jgi:hypothetical protein
VPSNAVPDSYVYSNTADQKYALGTILDLEDGRRFRYARAGTTALAVALMTQAEAATAQWLEEIQTGKSGAIGDTTYAALITTGATPAVDEWAEGWMVVNKGASELGHMYKIVSNTSHATAPTVTLADPGGLRVVISATSECSFVKNSWADVIVVPAGAGTNRPTGVPLVAFTANTYGWLQTRGPCPMTVDTGDTLVAGDKAGEPATGAVAGAVGVYDADGTELPYGYVMSIATAGETAIIDLQLE